MDYKHPIDKPKKRGNSKGRSHVGKKIGMIHKKPPPPPMPKTAPQPSPPKKKPPPPPMPKAKAPAMPSGLLGAIQRGALRYVEADEDDASRAEMRSCVDGLVDQAQGLMRVAIQRASEKGLAVTAMLLKKLSLSLNIDRNALLKCIEALA